jgi:GNAT superfamily N-acetyltransferase
MARAAILPYRLYVPLSIQRATAAETFPLRQRVLRPHETDDALSMCRDDCEPVHFAAVEDGTVVGTAVLFAEAAPWLLVGEASWRLRGMATAEDKRRQGVGVAVLAVVLDYVKLHGGGLLWCSARTSARSFYERAGFVSRGDVWDEPTLGPHVVMALHVESSAAPVSNDP